MMGKRAAKKAYDTPSHRNHQLVSCAVTHFSVVEVEGKLLEGGRFFHLILQESVD